jgi:hypothetical protein
VSPAAERRALQAAVALACLVPLLAGLAGVLAGPAMLAGVGAGAAPDLQSHYRYLSGLLLGIGFAFLALVPAIERRGALFGALAAIVALGGLARLLGLALAPAPGAAHLLALVMELGVTPGLALWQRRVARIWSKV